MSRVKAAIAKIEWRVTAPAILLVLSSFVWYILTYTVFANIVNGLLLTNMEKIGIFVIYFSSIAVTAILGSKVLSRKRNKALFLWSLFGVVTTILLNALSAQNMLINALIALSFGASVGIGLPSCLSYFAEKTSVENRGFTGGVTWSSVGLTVFLFAFALVVLGNWQILVLLAGWRLIGSIGFLGLIRKDKKVVEQKPPSYLKLIRKKEILLYLFPWIMFCIINFIEAPILAGFFGAETFAYIQVLEFAVIGIFAVVGGFVADVFGRKRVVIAGFVMLGVEYAILSLFSNSQATFYLFLALDGVTWGLLFSVFFTTVWGDLGENREKEKYYTLGGLPYLLSNLLSIIIGPYVVNIPSGLAFSFASFFLFMAVIPLMYAPETLPEKAMKDRELKSYVEKAQKLF